MPKQPKDQAGTSESAPGSPKHTDDNRRQLQRTVNNAHTGGDGLSQRHRFVRNADEGGVCQISVGQAGAGKFAKTLLGKPMQEVFAKAMLGMPMWGELDKALWSMRMREILA